MKIVDAGGLIDSQLRKDPQRLREDLQKLLMLGKVNWQSTWEVILQLCKDYLWEC